MLIGHIIVPQVGVNTAACVIDMTEGFLNLTKSDGEVAFALAHELAHVIAEHGRERWSQLTLLGLQITPWVPLVIPGTILMFLAVQVSRSFTKPAILFLGVPLKPVVNIYLAQSRTREREADYIGLLLMTDAGYDPAAASSIFEYLESSIAQLLLKLIQPTL